MEIVVVDNGSSDGSLDEIRATLGNTAIPYRVIPLETNRGVCGGYQVALEAARGDYFFAVASDDVMMPNRVRLQCDQLDNSAKGASIAAGAMRLIDTDGRVIRNIFRRPLVKRPPPYDDPGSAKMYAQLGKTPSGPCLAFRTEALRAIGGFDPSLPVQDLYSVMRLVLGTNATVETTNDVVTLYRRHSRNSGKVREVMNTPLDPLSPLEVTIARLIDLGIDFGPQADHWKGFLQRREVVRLSNTHLLSESRSRSTSPWTKETHVLMIARQQGMPLYRRARALAAFLFPRLAMLWIRHSWGDTQRQSGRRT